MFREREIDQRSASINELFDISYKNDTDIIKGNDPHNRKMTRQKKRAEKGQIGQEGVDIKKENGRRETLRPFMLINR